MNYEKQTDKFNNSVTPAIKDSLSAFNGCFSSELLAPAGSRESFFAAINAGADAVYMGGTMFGARAFADNPDEKQLLELIDYAHLHDKKLYLTVNTLLKEQELKVLYNYILPYYRHGLDGVIVQDFGVMKFLDEYFDGLPIHASTQMTITNSYLPLLLKETKNITRIVTARELSLEEINSIYTKTGLEIESFVHGALCYSYSGQCMFSSIAGNRSGNRGRCAQPCRLPYKALNNNCYVLSPKDLMTLKLLPEILKAGVYSLKIEGRMKKPEYVASVVSVYRHYLDLLKENGEKNYKVNDKDINILMDIYNRGNFTEGYYKCHNGKNMMSVERPNHTGLRVLKSNGAGQPVYTVINDINNGDILEINGESISITENFKSGKKVNIYGLLPKSFKKINTLPQYINRTRNNKLIEEITDRYLKGEEKLKVNIKIWGSCDSTLKIRVSCGDTTVSVKGDTITKAIKRPVTGDDVLKQIKKTGNTPFEIENTEILWEDNLFISLKACNELRRQAFDILEEELLKKYKRNNEAYYSEDNYNEIIEAFKYADKTVEEVSSVTNPEKSKFPYMNILVSSMEQLQIVVSSDYTEYFDKIYLDINFLNFDKLYEAVTLCHNKGLNAYIAMPYIFRSKTSEYIIENKDIILNAAADGFLIRSLEEYGFLIKEGFVNIKSHESSNIVFDSNIYGYNSYSRKFLKEFKPEYLTSPMELDYHELAELGISGDELFIYGDFPLMYSAQCVNKTTGNCKGGLETACCTVITDRLNNNFKSVPICRYCYSIIYNNKPLSLLNNKEKILQLSPEYIRLNFVFENPVQTEAVINDFVSVFYKDIPIESIGFISSNYTKGHFHRKVD